MNLSLSNLIRLFDLVSEWTFCPVATASSLIEHADLFGWSRLLTLQESVDSLIIFIVFFLPLVELLLFIEVSSKQPHLFSSDGFYNANLLGDRVITEDDSLAHLTLWKLIVVLKIVGVVIIMGCLWLVHQIWGEGLGTYWHLIVKRHICSRNKWLLLLIELGSHILDARKEHLALGVVWIDQVLNCLWVHAQLLHHVG